jgi:exodeoxyribonuclease-5
MSEPCYNGDLMQKFSTDQAAALTAIGQWHKDQPSQFITLGGYAGTGKTTLLAALRKLLLKQKPAIKVAFAAYTGKAALVLKTRLHEAKILQSGDSVGTLHSLMYRRIERSDGGIYFQKLDELKCDIIIIDEASMVNQDIWKDALSFGKPILAVGDHGQLPPINSEFNLMAKPELRLEKIWRQAVDSPIIHLATLARTEGAIPIGDYSPLVRKLDRANPETGDVVESILQAHSSDTMVLCGYNHTRQQLNSHIRELRGFESADPKPGDVVVCLRNNHDSGLVNGQLGMIESITTADNDPKTIWWHMVANFDGLRFSGYVPRQQFGETTTMSRVPNVTSLILLGYLTLVMG